MANKYKKTLTACYLGFITQAISANFAHETLRETVSHGSEEYPFKYYYEDIWLFDFHCIDWHWHSEVEFVFLEKGKGRFFEIIFMNILHHYLQLCLSMRRSVRHGCFLYKHACDSSV